MPMQPGIPYYYPAPYYPAQTPGDTCTNAVERLQSVAFPAFREAWISTLVLAKEYNLYLLHSPFVNSATFGVHPTMQHIHILINQLLDLVTKPLWYAQDS